MLRHISTDLGALKVQIYLLWLSCSGHTTALETCPHTPKRFQLKLIPTQNQQNSNLPPVFDESDSVPYALLDATPTRTLFAAGNNKSAHAHTNNLKRYSLNLGLPPFHYLSFFK